ncbi:MAG: C10 family peptidase [Prevotella sp.]|nr:C10 family peptidase [Prevotella sp.]
MNKRTYLIIIQLLICIMAIGQPRSESQALSIAKKFFSNDTNTRGTISAGVNLTLVSSDAIEKAIGRKQQSTTRNTGKNIGFYVFNDNANNRFVIVSGDERQYETLGSSDYGILDPERIPCGLLTFLEQYADEYDYLQTQHELQNDPKVESKTRSSYSSTSPLIKTKWDQGAPYNNDCPYASGGRCITGCVATAMAQVLNYHQFPERGEGIVKRIPGSNRLSSESLNLASKAFDWNSLANSEKVSTSSTTAKKNAVAYLMKACGYAVRMDYGTSQQGGSGAFPINIAPALVNNFGFDAKATYIQRNSNLSRWESLIQEELRNRRPIIYGGYGSGGHCFILDGYQASTGKYYFNWGWSGANDGAFALTSLRPASGHNYTNNQTMVYGITPEVATNIEKPVIYIDTDNDVATISCSTEGVKLYYSFTPQDQSSESSYSSYNGSKLSITRNGTFRAYAELKGKKNYADSKTVSWYKVEKPEFYPDGNELTIKCPSATTIYYTKDGKAPTKNSTKYTSSISLKTGTIIKAIGVKANYANSTVATFDYKEEIKTVYNFTNTAGNIANKINNASKLKVISLTVSGKLNGTDIKFIREMLSKGELSRLDMKNASIVSGGETYTGNSTENNVIGKYMFWKSPNLTSIVLPSNITKIGNSALQECPLLTKIDIPESCTSIGTQAFRETGLTSLTIPQNVTNIDWGIVQGCKALISIDVDKSNTSYDSRDNCNAIIDTKTGEIVAGCRRTIIPVTAKSIRMNGFCSSPKEMYIPGSIERISTSAFAENTELETLIAEEGVKYLYPKSFSDCTGLKKVSVPSTISIIFEQAFEGCSSLVTFTIYKDTPLEIVDSVFIGSNYKSATLRVPYGCKSKYETAAVWKDFKTIEEMDPVVNSVAEAKELQEGQYATLKLDEAQVLYAYNDVIDYAIIRDRSGACQLFGSYLFTEKGLNIKTGDIITGSIPIRMNITGSIQFISNKFEPKHFSITGNKAVVPKVVSADEVNSIENDRELVTVENVEMNGGLDYLYFSSSDENQIWVSPIGGLEPEDYEAFLVATKDIDFNGKKFTLTGIPYRQSSFYLTKPIVDVTPSGIRSIMVNQDDSGYIFDLQGRKVYGALKPGVYIKGGKKILIK